MFKVGDSVKCIDAGGYSDRITNGKIYKISDIEIRSSRDHDRLTVHDNNGGKTRMFARRFRLANPPLAALIGIQIDSAAALVGVTREATQSPISNPKSVVEIRPCTCDSMELFRKGCGCGAIMKQKWGLQG